MLVISTLRMQKQEDCCKFQASVVYIMVYRLERYTNNNYLNTHRIESLPFVKRTHVGALWRPEVGIECLYHSPAYLR